MESKALKIGWILMLILGIYRLVFSFLMPTMGYDAALGMILATNAVAIIGISLVPYRKGEKWSWWVLLIIGVVPLLGWSFELQEATQIVGATVGWILLVLGLAIPVKAILGKKST